MIHKILMVMAAILLNFNGLAMYVGAGVVAGSTSGLFENPSPPNTVFSGVGTKTFAYGDEASRLTFDGVTINNTQLGEEFTIGHLTYYNGSSYAALPGSVDLNLELDINSPVASMHSVVIHFGLLGTANNSGLPDPDADYVSISASPLPAFQYGGIAYSFELLGFGNVGGQGSLTAPNTLRLGEQHTATADLIGRITAVAVQPVPEPSSVALTGLAAVFGLAYLSLRTRKPSIAGR